MSAPFTHAGGVVGPEIAQGGGASVAMNVRRRSGRAGPTGGGNGRSDRGMHIMVQWNGYGRAQPDSSSLHGLGPRGEGGGGAGGIGMSLRGQRTHLALPSTAVWCCRG